MCADVRGHPLPDGWSRRPTFTTPFTVNYWTRGGWSNTVNNTTEGWLFHRPEQRSTHSKTWTCGKRRNMPPTHSSDVFHSGGTPPHKVLLTVFGHVFGVQCLTVRGIATVPLSHSPIDCAAQSSPLTPRFLSSASLFRKSGWPNAAGLGLKCPGVRPLRVTALRSFSVRTHWGRTTFYFTANRTPKTAKLNVFGNNTHTSPRFGIFQQFSHFWGAEEARGQQSEFSCCAMPAGLIFVPKPRLSTLCRFCLWLVRARVLVLHHHKSIVWHSTQVWLSCRTLPGVVHHW